MSLAALFVVLSVALIFVRLRTIQEKRESAVRMAAIFRFRYMVPGALFVFCYFGAEVGIVSFLIRHARAQQLMGLSEQKAALLIALFVALVLLGRLAGAWPLQRVDLARFLTLCELVAALLVVLSMMLNWLSTNFPFY